MPRPYGLRTSLSSQATKITYTARAFIFYPLASHITAFLSREAHNIAMKAIWNGEVIAESSDTVVVEGNHYFPAESVKAAFLRASSTHTTCPWKGVASYHSLEVNGQINADAAWFYPTPKDAAKQIAGRIAFWKGVQVSA